MPLGNGHHLLVWQRLGLRRPERYLTTLQYRYVYQATVDDESWIFRYEYDREPEGAYPYSRCHVHVNATPATYSGREPFPDLHLPAGERVTIEEVVRHLVVEHGVTPVSRDWEKTLEEAATDWAEIQSRRRASR